MGYGYFERYEGGKVSTHIRWTCDVYGCRAAEDAPDDGQPVKWLMPPDWSGVRVTSMTDGDYGYIQCPTHTLDLHRRYGDGMDHFQNLMAVGG